MLDLVIRIAIEAPLALVLMFTAMGFWQAIATRRVTRKRTQDQEFLDRFIATLNEETPFSLRTAHLEKFQGSWAYNVMLVAKVSHESIGSLRNFNLVICVAILIGSYFLGIIFLGINVGLFLLLGLVGQTNAAVNTAYTDLLSMAQLLYKWKREEPDQYALFLEEAWSMRKMNDALDRYAT